jgi:cobalt-zinc-cadmium efflux system membrane fusion protein
MAAAVVSKAGVDITPAERLPGKSRLMVKSRILKPKLLGLLVLVVVLAGLGVAAIPQVKEAFSHPASSNPPAAAAPAPLELFQDKDGNYGLILSPKVIDGYRINSTSAASVPGVAEVKVPKKESRALPPQVGHVNYDSDGLFPVRPRFQGELVEITKVVDTDGPVTPTRYRPLRYGDRVRGGDVLGIVYSKDLGEKKAALVDAMTALALSKNKLERYEKLYKDGSIGQNVYKDQERQVQADSNAVLTAKRTLKVWKVTDEEIKKIEDEARDIIDLKKVRDPEKEKLWARVEVKAPGDPERELVVMEKNTNVGDMVDPSRDPPLYRLADLRRLQIWVQPLEGFLPMLQERLAKGPLYWEIRFQFDPPETPPLKLPILQIARQVDINVRTLMVIGYLPNPKERFLIGQPLTATIFMDPEANTVEIPTDALNEVEGESLVFVETDAKKRSYTLKRVAVAQRFKDVTYIRSVLTDRDKELSEFEVKRGKRPIQPLAAGERVLTRGVVELAEALDNLVLKARIAQQKK